MRIFLISIMFATSLFAANSSPKNYIVYSAIKKRCRLHYSKNYYQCKDAVYDMIRVMDMHYVKINNPPEKQLLNSFNFIAFKKYFIKIMHQQSTKNYLLAVNEELNKFIVQDNYPFNLWNFSLKFFNHDEFKTAGHIATLFQDTTYVQAHIQYIYSQNIKGSKLFEENMDQLTTVLNNITTTIDYPRDLFGKTFFPENFQTQMNNSIYHFYVPLFLNMILNKSLRYNKKISTIATLMLTATYEFITAGNELEYLFVDPVFLKSEYKIRDIFTSFKSGQFFLQNKNHKAFNIFNNAFQKKTVSKAMKVILN